MAQKRFVFDDEKETVQTQQSLSQIDQYENYKHSEEKKIIDKKETISKIPKDSFSPQYSMKETIQLFHICIPFFFVSIR